jgi:hypothetical protein
MMLVWLLLSLWQQVSLPADYPSSSPPVVELSATWMADEDMAVMLSHLDAVTRYL